MSTTILAKETPGSMKELLSSISFQVGGKSQYDRFKRMYSNDRVAFVYDCIPEVRETLTSYNVEILSYFDEGIDRVAVRGPHGLGKTFMASCLVHHTALTAEYDCKIPTTASAWRQLEKYLWPEIKKTGKMLDWTRIGREPYDPNREMHSLSLKLRDGSVEAFAIASDDHTTIEGAHATVLFYIFDEAKTIPRPTWDAAEGAFSTAGLTPGHRAMAFAISTPGDPAGQFYDIHMRAPGFGDWKVRHVTLEECIRAKRVSKVWAMNRKTQWGETSSIYQNRVRGEFASNSEDGVIPMSWVTMAMDRYKEWEKAGKPAIRQTHGKKAIGVDVAREGTDKTVIAVRDALTLQNLHMFSKLPTTGTAGHATALGRNRYIHIEIDGGLGAGVYDMMRADGVQLLRPITVNGGTTFMDRSKEYTFLNVRAAMWWNMRELLDPQYGHEILLYPSEDLKRDLVTPRYEVGREGVVKLESKKSIKKRIGKSTDYGDACCLAFWSPSSGGGKVF